MAAAPMMAATRERVHIGQPADSTIAAVSPAPPTTATAPTTRRPWRSAMRPPTTTPRNPGVFVRRLNRLMRAAENPRSSRRNWFSSCAAGAVKRDSRNAETARSTNRLPWPAIGTRAWATSNRRLSGRSRPIRATTGSPSRVRNHSSRQPPGPVSASGSAIKQMPTPSAPQSPSRLMPKARAPAGISSTATTVRITAHAVTSARTTSWLRPTATRSGESPPRADATHATEVPTRSTLRRPRRSASAVRAMVAKMLIRTAARTALWSPVLAPNSSAAKVMVWVSRVPR